MKTKNYGQELAKANETVRGLQGELEGKILGQTRNGWKCYGSRMECITLEATKISHPYLGLVSYPLQWYVHAKGKSTGEEILMQLSNFLPGEKIQEIFDKYLTGVDLESIYLEGYARELEEKGEKELASKVRNRTFKPVSFCKKQDWS